MKNLFHKDLILKSTIILLFFTQTPKTYCSHLNSLSSKTEIFRQNEQKENLPVVFLTIPKSGTHLLEKAYNLITNTSCTENDDSHWMGFDFFKFIETPESYFIGRKKQYSFNHFWFESELSSRLNCDGLKLVLLIRDPRDVIISIINSYPKMIWRNIDPTWPLDKKISTLIEDNTPNTSLKSMYETALKCMNIPFAHVIYFEDLVGPEGGGDLEKQKTTIRKLADYVGHSLSDNQIDTISQQLFGGTKTFNKGQIGSWKNLFTSQNEKLFNQIMGTELQLLGYK